MHTNHLTKKQLGSTCWQGMQGYSTFQWKRTARNGVRVLLVLGFGYESDCISISISSTDSFLSSFFCFPSCDGATDLWILFFFPPWLTLQLCAASVLCSRGSELWRPTMPTATMLFLGKLVFGVQCRVSIPLYSRMQRCYLSWYDVVTYKDIDIDIDIVPIVSIALLKYLLLST